MSFSSYHFLLGLAIITLPLSSAHANETEDQLWDNARETFQETKKKLVDSYDIGDISTILSSHCEIDWSNIHQVDALKSQASVLSSTYGLELRGGYTSDNIEQRNNNDDGSTYLELSWDVLRNGLRENKYKATDLKRQAAILELSGALKRKELQYQCRRYQIGQFFKGMEVYLNAKKLSFMESIHQVEKQAYFTGMSYLDELLITEQDIDLARQSLAYLQEPRFYNETQISLFNPPIVNVDLLAVIKKIEQSHYFSETKRLTRLRLEDTKEETILDKSRFRLFLRKEFDLAREQSDALVAGLRFQVPLSFAESPVSIKQSSLNQLENDLSHEKWEIVTRTRAAYESLQEQLERVTKQNYRLLMAQEKIHRIENLLSVNKALDIAAVNVRIKTYLDAAIELIQAKEELYRRVNEVFLVSRVDFDPSLVHIHSDKRVNYRARKGERALYLWSDEFNQYTNQQLLALVTTKKIKNVLLSNGKPMNQAKRLQFIKDADKRGLQITQLIGEPNWARAANHAKALAKIEQHSHYSNSINLDIEPHTLSSFSGNEKQVLAQYLDLIEQVRLRHPNINLSVSVPYHWPEHVYQTLADQVDQIFIMAYGSTSLEKITQRVKRIVNATALDKVVVALRQEDFNNELALEEIIEALAQATGIHSYAVHKIAIYSQE